MSVRDILIVAVIGLIMYPLICVTVSTCTEIIFSRKEKHIGWIFDAISKKLTKKKDEDKE